MSRRRSNPSVFLGINLMLGLGIPLRGVLIMLLGAAPARGGQAQ